MVLFPPEQVELVRTPFPVPSNSQTLGPCITTHWSWTSGAPAGGTDDSLMQYRSTSVEEARLPWMPVSGPFPMVPWAVGTVLPASPVSLQTCARAGDAVSRTSRAAN